MEMDKLCCEVENKEILAFFRTKSSYSGREISSELLKAQCTVHLFRESSFNMTRGRDEDIEGGLRKFLDTRKGGSKNLYTFSPKGGGLLKN